jgi:hypothetical protein
MRDVTVTLVDDLDHSKADETVSFGLDGRDYELDLSRANAGELRRMVSRYIAVARRAGTVVHRRTPRRTQADRERARAMRAWAVQRGMMTSERGRIPEHVRREYEAAQRAAAVPSKAPAAPRPARDDGAARKPRAHQGRPKRTTRRPAAARK